MTAHPCPLPLPSLRVLPPPQGEPDPMITATAALAAFLRLEFSERERLISSLRRIAVRRRLTVLAGGCGVPIPQP